MTSAEYPSLQLAFERRRDSVHPKVADLFRGIEMAYHQASAITAADVRKKKPDVWIQTARADKWAPTTKQLVSAQSQAVVDALTNRFGDRPELLAEILETLSAVSV
jgi:hypothetical protein